MKRIIVLLCLGLCNCLMFAQEGEAYRGLTKAIEKIYTVTQKHGKNILLLDTQSTLFYDENGSIIEKYMMKGNLSYLGKEIRFNRNNPHFKEILVYNHMNGLVSRSVEYGDPQTGNHSSIMYDSKGKVLNKVQCKSTGADSLIWEMHYNQVGYLSEYFKIQHNKDGTIDEKTLFDYKDDVMELHKYIYDPSGLLSSIVVTSPGDSLLYKMRYRYDESANLLEQSKTDSGNLPMESTIYSYDDRDRLIMRLDYSFNPRYGGTPNLRTQYEYSYE